MASSQTVAPAPAAASPEPYLPHRRVWPRRVLIGLNVFVALCLLGAGSLYAYVTYRFGQIHRQGGLTDLVAQDAGSPMTILMVGSDTRADINGKQIQQFGSAAQVGGQRSDTIMLLHLDPGAGKATLMSIPRDLLVQVPGTTYHDRINSTFDKGPDLLIRAIHDSLGIDINHYVEVDFNSFRGIVNAIGVVHIYYPTPARDVFSGINITTPGCYGLNGDEALAFVRSRHYEYYLNGRWNFEAESDIARIRRQQFFIKRVMSKAISAGLNNPAKLNGVVGSVVSNLTVDSAFSQSDMLRLAKRYRTFSPDQLATMTLPTLAETVDLGGAPADVLKLDQPAAADTINGFLGVQPPTPTTTPGVAGVSPGDVQVKVLNGSGVGGQAASVAAALRQDGFVVTGAAAADSYRYITSVIRYADGQQAKAQYLQSLVSGGAQIVPDPGLSGTNLELVTGSSWSGLRPVPGAGAPGAAPTSGGPATTGAPATTTTTRPPLPGTPANTPLPPCAP